MKFYMTIELAQALVDEYTKSSYGAIAEKCGVHKQTMRHRIVAAHALLGVKMPRIYNGFNRKQMLRVAEPAWVADALPLINAGRTVTETARHIGIHPSNLYTYLRRHQIPFRHKRHNRLKETP
jgi:transposase-like protein